MRRSVAHPHNTPEHSCCVGALRSATAVDEQSLQAASKAEYALQSARSAAEGVSHRLGAAAAAAMMAAAVLTTPTAAMADLVQVSVPASLIRNCSLPNNPITPKFRKQEQTCMHSSMHVQQPCLGCLPACPTPLPPPPCLCLSVCCVVQTVPVSQVTQMAKPLPKQTIDKGKVGLSRTRHQIPADAKPLVCPYTSVSAHKSRQCIDI